MKKKQVKKKVKVLVEDGSNTVGEISRKLNIAPSIIENLLLSMLDKGEFSTAEVAKGYKNRKKRATINRQKDFRFDDSCGDCLTLDCFNCKKYLKMVRIK